MQPNEVFQVPERHTYLNWFKALLLGSCVWPLLAGLNSIGDFEFKNIGYLLEGWLWLAVLSTIISALLSFPALLLLIILTGDLNQRNWSVRHYRMRHNTWHVMFALLTFGALFWWFIGAGTSQRESRYLFLIAFTYTTAGLFFWNRLFYRHIKETKHAEQ